MAEPEINAFLRYLAVKEKVIGAQKTGPLVATNKASLFRRP